MKNRRNTIAGSYYRVPRPQPFRFTITPPKPGQVKNLLSSNPLLVSVLGILLLVLVGTGLLMLPMANAEGNVAPFLTALFTSASAVSTTGLATVTTATYWTIFGQAVVCALFFLGGLGLVAAVMFGIWLTAARFTLQDRLLLREAMGVGQLGGVVAMLRNVVLIDILITATGALLLIGSFRQYYGPSMAVWQAIFHSVSSFNTAGFDIVGAAGFIPFRSDARLLAVTIAEGLLGAISFSVLTEVPRVHSWRRFSLNTKLVICWFGLVTLLAGGAIFAYEALLGVTLSGFSIPGMALTSLFNGLSASTTTGFATIDFGQATVQTLLVIAMVMLIGGATGSTAGGIKVNTVAVLAASVWSSVRGREDTESFGRQIAPNLVIRALAVAAVSLAVVLAGTFLIMVSSPGIPFERVLFEAMSAFGTVGLSAGALAGFSDWGQVVTILLMVVGRVAPLSVFMILAPRKGPALVRYPEAAIFMG